MKRSATKTIGYFIVDADATPLVVSDDYDFYYQSGVATYFPTRASARSSLDCCIVNLKNRMTLDADVRKRFQRASIFRISATTRNIAALIEEAQDKLALLPAENNND